MRHHRTARTTLAIAFLAALGSAATAHAQYFGRNTVRWERLKFAVLSTEHFDIHYYPEGREVAEQAGRLAERWYARLSRILGHEFKQRQPIILYASQPQFQQTNTLGGAPGEGTGGVTEAYKRRIVLPVGASLAETDHVLGHELVHAFQYDMTGHGKVSETNYPAALNMPLWFIEGMAEYLSLGPVDPHTAMWIRDAARQEKGLPTIHQPLAAVPATNPSCARLAALQNELQTGNRAAVESFWQDVARHGTPLVEPVPDRARSLLRDVPLARLGRHPERPGLDAGTARDRQSRGSTSVPGRANTEQGADAAGVVAKPEAPLRSARWLACAKEG